jgi:hypothetical protein
VENVIRVLSAEFFKALALGTYNKVKNDKTNQDYYNLFVRKMKEAAGKGLVRYSSDKNTAESAHVAMTYQFRKSADGDIGGSHYFSIIADLGQVIHISRNDTSKQAVVLYQQEQRLNQQQQQLEMQSQTMQSQRDAAMNIIKSIGS